MRARLIERIQKRIKYHADETKYRYEIGKGVMECLANDLIDDFVEMGGILPPCKVGDTVYVVCRSHFSERATIREKPVIGLKYHNGYWYIDTQGEHLSLQYGLTVFTKYDEALKAQKERDT
jgi:hypothetical protein